MLRLTSSTGAVHISYSYIHRRQTTLQEPQDVFHTRQLSYPVLVTVYHMLECHSMDIMPYSPDAVAELMAQLEETEHHTVATRRALLNVSDVMDWCLFSVEVRNSYGLPFEVTFERDQPGELSTRLRPISIAFAHRFATDVENASTTLLVPPGSTSRYISRSLFTLGLLKLLFQDHFAYQKISTLRRAMSK